MTRLTAAAYLTHLRSESQRFREVIAATTPEVLVPACPEWDVDDLLWHLAEVQWFWGSVIATRPEGPPDEHPNRPEGRAALLAFFDDASATLIEGLSTARVDEQAWSWAADQTVGFTLRRQAHEAMIHRLDAEQAAGAVTELPSDLAADGVAELMEVMYGGAPPPWARFTPSGRHTLIDLTDTGDRIRVATGLFDGSHPESGRTYHKPHVLRLDDDGPVDVTISGPAADLDAWLWRRRDDSGITIDGDQLPLGADAFAEWSAAVREPLV